MSRTAQGGKVMPVNRTRTKARRRQEKASETGKIGLNPKRANPAYATVRYPNTVSGRTDTSRYKQSYPHRTLCPRRILCLRRLGSTSRKSSHAQLVHVRPFCRVVWKARVLLAQTQRLTVGPSGKSCVSRKYRHCVKAAVTVHNANRSDRIAQRE